jgi:hypothetical protein
VFLFAPSLLPPVNDRQPHNGLPSLDGGGEPRDD